MPTGVAPASEGLAARLIRRVEPLLTPILLFLGVYFLSLVLWANALPTGIAFLQWSAFFSAATASVVCWLLLERRGTAVALVVGSRALSGSLIDGALTAGCILVGADLIIRVLSPLETAAYGGVPWEFVLAVIIPAVVHEELLLRGYLFQKLARFSAPLAVIVSSLSFALLHLGNSEVSGLALVNIAIGGVLLSVAFLVRRNLWYPISIHFFWNVISGPLLGHEVSGFVMPESLLILRDRGPAIVTGAGFGIEGSVVMTFTESAVLALLLWRLRRRNRLRSGGPAVPV